MTRMSQVARHDRLAVLPLRERPEDDMSLSPTPAESARMREAVMMQVLLDQARTIRNLRDDLEHRDEELRRHAVHGLAKRTPYLRRLPTMDPDV